MSKWLQMVCLLLYCAGNAWAAFPFAGLALAGAATTRTEVSLKEFLQNYVGKNPSERDKTTRYLQASVDLDGNGKEEIIVYLVGGGWCGSGGCTALILEPQQTSYKVGTRMSVVQFPIRVLTATSHGWHNLAVLVRGGGILKPYEAELRFDGNTYPTNPTVPPARALPNDAKGEEVVPDNPRAATPLFP